MATLEGIDEQPFPEAMSSVRLAGSQSAYQGHWDQRITRQLLADRVRPGHTAVVTRDPPAQSVPSNGWSRLSGTYRLFPDGWTFHVELRDEQLYGGRDPDKLKHLIP